MDRFIHLSLSAMRGAMAQQTATANNIANISTTGFRGDMAAAQSMWLRGDQLATRAMASTEVRGVDLRAGQITETGRDLDIAMRGDALLSVQSADGEEAYSRRGDLQIGASGLLTTGDGHPLLGEGGPITVPPADSIRIADDGAIWIVPTGGDPSQPQRVDRIKIVSPQGSDVVKGLDNLLRVDGGGTLPDDPEGRLTSRSIEGSNVEPTQALIDMIEASRSFDTQMKLISTARELGSATSDLMQMPS
jgi:flagellar basal-body rod protein FlgF